MAFMHFLFFSSDFGNAHETVLCCERYFLKSTGTVSQNHVGSIASKPKIGIQTNVPKSRNVPNPRCILINIKTAIVRHCWLNIGKKKRKGHSSSVNHTACVR